MADPPPPPQVSADGRFYWDGQRWAPMQQPLSPPPQSPWTATAVPRASTNTLAVVSLVFGIMSWLVCPLIGGTVAAACGQMARGQIKQTGESGDGLATAGMVLGWLNLAACAVVLLFWILAVVARR